MKTVIEATNKPLAEKVKEQLRQTTGFSQQTVSEIREGLVKQAEQLPPLPGVVYREAGAEGIAGEWVHVEDGTQLASDSVILYLHGGGFVAGSATVYRDLAARISRTSRTPVLTVNYRLAPEHPYPAAHEDCLNAYRALIRLGFAPERILLGGDSIGASLVLMTLLQLRDEAAPLPSGAFLLSPHTDLVHLDGESYESNAKNDPTGSREANERLLSAYWQDRGTDIPLLLSPLRCDLSGLPPLLIQVGSDEVLLSDAVRFATAAESVDVSVRLEIWESMWCAFQTMAFLLPEATAAIEHIGSFIRERLERLE
ncbi:alpha/beta hydrolase [Gorillibacterium timonense]|uniref:alpha/beta hydrolase n=1 Tax=Gorillibacterium timonense TaxID=1689269 RepID=UPI00071DF75A|nr:alpha/beta hydrolase [Gorillibacterium timonense]